MVLGLREKVMDYTVVTAGYVIQRQRRDGSWVLAAPRAWRDDPIVYATEARAEAVMATFRRPARNRVVAYTVSRAT